MSLININFVNDNIKTFYDYINKDNQKNIFARFMKDELMKQFIVKELKNLEVKENKLYININNVKSLISTKYIFDKVIGKFFDNKINYACDNVSCENSKKLIRTRKNIIKCPACSTSLRIDNYDKLENSLLFILTKYKYFYLESAKDTNYLIYDTERNLYFIKQGDSNLKTWLFNMLKNENVDSNTICWQFLKTSNNDTSFEKLIFDFFKENVQIKNIWDLGFKPTNEILFNDDSKVLFNEYKGNKYLNLECSETNKDVQKDCPHIYELLFNICGKDQEGVNYMINLLSFILNNPEKRTQKMIVLAGEQGSGKGIFFNEILDRLFKNYVSHISGRELDNQFNNFLSKKLILTIEETLYTKKHTNILKTWITEPKIYINHPNGRKETEDVYFNMFVSSNENKPLSVEGRRLVYFKSKTLGGNYNKSSQIGLEIVNSIPNEIDSFAKILKSKDVCFDIINKGYTTQAKLDLEDAIKPIEDQFKEELLNSSNMWELGFNLSNKYDYKKEYKILGIKENYLVGQEKDFIKVSYFLEVYNLWRIDRGLKTLPVTMRNFSIWFYDKFNIDRENKTQFKTMLDTDRKKHLVISREFIEGMFKDEK